MELARMGGRMKRVIVSINPLGRLLCTDATYVRACVRSTHARESIRSTEIGKW